MAVRLERTNLALIGGPARNGPWVTQQRVYLAAPAVDGHRGRRRMLSCGFSFNGEAYCHDCRWRPGRRRFAAESGTPSLL